MIKIAAENLVDLGCWRISRDAVANRLGPSIKRLGPVRFPPGNSMIGGQKSGSLQQSPNQRELMLYVNHV